MALVKKKRLLIPLNNPRKRSVWLEALAFVLRAVFVPVSFVFGKMYRLCFGWLDKRYARKYDEELEGDIRSNLMFLFAERNASVVSEAGADKFRTFDASYVTVSADTLLFNFCRFRGDLKVQVAWESDPTSFEDLYLVLDTILNPSESRQALRENCYYLRTLPRVLHPHFDALKAALTKERYSETLQNAAKTHNDRVDEQVAELRARGINPKIF